MSSKDNKLHPSSLESSHIALNLITEDPLQPRKYFDPEALEELTETVRTRGVKTPISVRHNPEKEGTYIINHGARRYRASKKAGKETIPAYIDNDYNLADQVIENLQRSNLTPREILDFVGRQIAFGKSHGQIGKEIGKTESYVFLYASILDLPDPIAGLLNTGTCTDVTALYRLKNLFKEYPLEVNDWIINSAKKDITRGNIEKLKKYLTQKTEEKKLSAELLYDEPDLLDSANGDYPKREEGTEEVEEVEESEEAEKTGNEKLLTNIYTQFKKGNRTPDNLSDEQKKMIHGQLKPYFTQGQECEDVTYTMLKLLRQKRFDGIGRGAFNLTAFFYGVNKKVFDMEKIIQDVYLTLR